MKIVLDLQWKWEDLCGPQGLQPWNETSKDFGICFQELFFQVPVYYLIAIVSGFFVGYRKDWVIRDKTQEHAVVLRSFAVLALVFIPIIQLYIFITDTTVILYPIDYFTSGAACLAWLVHFGYVLALKHRLSTSARGPMIQISLWSISVIFTLAALRTNIKDGNPIAFSVANLCCHGLYFFTLLPSSNSRSTFYSPCLVGSQHTHSEYTPLLPHMDEEILGTAMQGISWWSKLNFKWINPLLLKGMANKLNDPEELFDLPGKYRCSYIGARMDRALIGNVDEYQQFAEVPHEPFIGSGYGSTGESVQVVTPTAVARVLVSPSKRHNVSLIRAMHSCFAVQFYSIGVLKLVSDMAGFAGPLLLNKLVSFVDDNSIDQHFGYLYAAGLLAATLISAICIVHFNWLMSLVGLKMRGALVSTILRKTLSVSSTALTNSFSVGEITNFMSTDTDRIVNSCPSFHALWSIPLQLFITLFLLYTQVGISFLAGVAFSVALIPLNKVVANKIGKLSTDMMKHKDTRVTYVSELLKGILTIKVHVWEDYFKNKINAVREQELRYLRGRKYLDAVCVVLWASTPVMVAALTLGVHSLRGMPLDAPTVFTTVALINMLIAPLNAFPWVLNGLTEAWVSIKRIQQLLNHHDTNIEDYYDRINKNFDEDTSIILKNASFSWARPLPKKVMPSKTKKNKGKSKKNISRDIEIRDPTTSASFENKPFMLQDLNLEIARGDFICVMGNVGSGKSSLLMAIIGEMLKKGGSIQVAEDLTSFGYVSQKVWLVHGTVRENILFGKTYDHAKFRAVIDACALTEDLDVLGWNAFVGEGGCTLSGGQKMRIALARAVYQDKQVYLLDDVLSGLDGTVAAHIMQRCILGLLRDKTRVLVTHSTKYAANAHRIILLDEGKIAADGPPEVAIHEIEEILPSDTESIGEEPLTASTDISNVEKDLCDDNVSRNTLEDEETMSQGTVSWWVIGLYLKSVGYILTIIIIISLILMQLSQNITFLWLAYWVKARSNNSSAVDTFPENLTAVDHGYSAVDNLFHTIVKSSVSLLHKLDGHEDLTTTTTAKPVYERLSLDGKYNDNYYLEVYFGLAGINLVFTIMRAFLFAYGGVLAGARLHRKLLNVVIRAKMKFFDVTPIGRILNRFSSDMYTVDDSLPFILNILLAQTFGLIGAVVVTLYGIPWLLAAVVPMCCVLYYVQSRYRPTSRQLKRLQSVTLSPLLAHFNYTIEGLSSVRALGGAEAWAARGDELTERWQRAALCAAAAAQWLALRLQAAAAACVCAAAALAVLQRQARLADAGLVGLAISYALSMTSMLSNVLNSFTETEREMIAVERLGEYLQIETESMEGEHPPYGWPSHGVLAFEDVSLTYSKSGQPALSNVTLSTAPAEKLGVVGRTGAGKSSLLRAVLRLSAYSGRVRLDGVDLATLHLPALRSRIGMIPQEPFIFAGTIRENLDPLQQHGEAQLLRAVQAAGAGGVLEARGGLDAPAAGLSRGAAQLLCLARALLQRHKVVLVDEATANLDANSERAIVEALGSALGGSTVVWVAHRAAGVLQCARAAAMAAGRLRELRAPRPALADPASLLRALLAPHHEATPH